MFEVNNTIVCNQPSVHDIVYSEGYSSCPVCVCVCVCVCVVLCVCVCMCVCVCVSVHNLPPHACSSKVLVPTCSPQCIKNV